MAANSQNNNTVIVNVQANTQQATQALGTLEQRINDVVNNPHQATFGQIRNVLQDAVSEMNQLVAAGRQGSAEFTRLAQQTQQLRNAATQAGHSLQSLTAGNNTFQNIANQAQQATQQTATFANTVSQVGATTQNSNQAMSRFHGLLEFSDRASSVEGLGGAFGFLNSMLGFSTMALGEYGSAQATADRAAQQAAAAQANLTTAQQATQQAQQALTTAQQTGNGVTQAQTALNRAQAQQAALTTRATQAQTAATNASSDAARGFRSALLSIGIGVFLLALSTLVENWESLEKILAKVTSRQKELNTVNAEARKNAAAEISQLRYLYAVSTDVNKSKEQRIAAVKKLQEQYPSYFKNMTTEQIMVGKASKAYQELTNAIMASARAKAAQSKLEEIAQNQLDKEANSLEFIAGIQKEIDSNNKKIASGNYGFLENEKGLQNRNKQLEALVNSTKRTTKESVDELNASAKFYQDFVAKNEQVSTKLEKDRSAKAPKAATDKTNDELKRQREEALKIQKEATLENELFWFGEQDKELIILKRGYEEKKALLIKAGVDTSALTEKYENDKTNINAKYDKIRDDNRQKKADEEYEAQKELNEKLRQIAIDSEKALADSLEGDMNADIFINKQAQLNAITKFFAQKKYIEDLEYEAEKERLAGQKEALALLELNHANRIAQINKEQQDKITATEKENADKRKEIADKEREAKSAIAGSISDILGTMSETLEEGTLGQKAMAIAATTIQTIQSGVAAYNGMVTAIPGPWGIAAGIAAAASSLASGYASVRKIVAVKVNGKTGSSSVPNLDQANFASAPVVNAQQAQGNNDVRITNPDDMMIRAYIPESDLEDANRRKQFIDNLGGF